MKLPGLFDLIPWDALVAPGILSSTDGALTRAFRYQGPDLSSAEPARLNALAEVTRRALDLTGDRWIVSFDAFRHPAPPYPATAAFSDPFSRALDAERKRAYEAQSPLALHQFLTLTWCPVAPKRPETDANALKASLDARLSDFLRDSSEVQQLLGTALAIEPLTSPELLEHLHRCLTFRSQPLRTTDPLEAVLSDCDVRFASGVQVDELTVIPIAIGGAGFPSEVASGAFDWIAADFPLRYHLRILPLSPYSATHALDKKRSEWFRSTLRLKTLLSLIFGAKGQAPSDASTLGTDYESTMLGNTKKAAASIQENQTSVGYTTPVLFVSDSDPSEAHHRATQLVAELRNRGYTAWIETINAPDAYLGALPSLGSRNIRRPLVTHQAAASLAPLTTPWIGHVRHPHPILEDAHAIAYTDGATPFHLALAHGDVQHTIILGPTGTGKSVLVNFLISQFLRFPSSRVFAFDKGYSQLLLAHATGGAHYDLDPSSSTGLRLAPLAALDEPADFQAAEQWLEELFRNQGIELTPNHRTRIHEALGHLRTSDERTLANFAIKLQDHALREALAPFLPGGTYGTLFAGNHLAIDDDRRYIVFELEEALRLGAGVTTPVVLHLFHEVFRRLDGRPTLLICEELAAYIRDSLFATRLEAALLQVRKRRAGVLLATQTPGSILDSAIKDAVLENCPVRLFLPNPKATDEHGAVGYQAFGLNARQRELLTQALPRRDYYYDSPDGSRLFHLGLSPAALDILGSSGPAAQKRFADLKARHGADWLQAHFAAHHPNFPLLEGPACHVA